MTKRVKDEVFLISDSVTSFLAVPASGLSLDLEKTISEYVRTKATKLLDF
jgi:hypothetical protein